MPIRHYHKLVRNHIPQIIKKEGARVQTRRAEPQERWPLLTRKLVEEANELAAATTAGERLEELVDILEITEAIRRECRISRELVEEARETKHRERGGFSRFVVLVSVETKSNSPKLRYHPSPLPSKK